MPDIEIKRGYEVLPDNNVRFGVRVINNSDSAVSDVEVILDYSESLFEIESDKIQKLGTIPPTVPRTAKFILKPLGCIHKEELGATVRYKDHQWKKHVEEMRPKEVHCVCPFLKEKSITRADFLRMSNSGYLEERGVNFEGTTVDKLTDLLTHTCKNRLYKVDEFPVENGEILYLSGDAVGEKAYYLLTAVVKEYEGLTQVLLRASSDKSYGLNGFLNEIMDNLRHIVLSANVREIGIIRKEHVINIIDSVVQRSTISMEEGAPSIKIKDSMVQRTKIKGDEERKRKEEERKVRQIAEIKERQNAVAGEPLKTQKELLIPKTEPNSQGKNKWGWGKKAFVAVGMVFIIILLAGVISAFVFGIGDTSAATPLLNIIASNNPNTAEADMRIAHMGGDPLMGGEWKLSIVHAGNPPNYVISSAGIDFKVGDQIIAAATTEEGAYITTGEGAYKTDSAVNGNVNLLSGKKYDVKLVHIPSNAMLLDQVVEVR
ncbi:MAG: type IV pilin N-terminal domain-containing protein [Candidatus Methanoperedens sp.]|nr:type IV pilin N-terminal domain-containing protein [Candidatus Methanoperedens sp.]MCZ7406061.1 type IV pilin N-terminal domain-containing protein [Candidatus Methanoperedens sp.]